MNGSATNTVQFQDALALLESARSAEARGQLLEAAALLQRAIQRYPHLPSLWGRIAKLLAAGGQFVAAIEAAGNELEIRPDNLEALSIIIAHQAYLPQTSLGREDNPRVRLVNELCEAVSQQSQRRA